ncbi:MAG: DedA family protein [Imperialibacter sp.]|uniref:DedA family protein n=1 Tax=Imperialibacter sp. TaxID=2038411 RepID=UPI0032EE5355
MIEEAVAWLNPEKIIQVGGVSLLVAIVFLETGVFFGFFLPGDSLLLTAGFLAKLGVITMPLPMLLAILTLASFTGTWVGFLSGKHIRISSPVKWLSINKRHLVRARAFYEHHGVIAMIIGKFLPVIRTFLPILAGMVGLGARRFGLFNMVGSCSWVGIMVLAGYFLGALFPALHQSLAYVVLVVVVVSMLPLMLPGLKRLYLQLQSRTISNG